MSVTHQRDVTHAQLREPVADVEALRRAIERLCVLVSSESQAILEVVLDHSPHGVIVCDATGKVTLHNRAAARIWAGRVTANSMSDWGGYRAFHPDGRPYEIGDWPMMRCLSRGAIVDAQEVWIERFDRTRALILGSCAPIFGLNAELRGVLSVFADITEFRSLAAAERAARSERLRRITGSLLRAITPEDVTNVVLRDVTDALRADVGSVSLLSADGRTVETVAFVGDIDLDRFEKLRSSPIESRLPAADAIRSREPVFIESPETFATSYEWVSARTPFHGGTRCALPLIAGSTVLGSMNFGFQVWRPVLDDERAFMHAAADQCALALERAQLFAAEHRARADAERLHRDLERALRTRDDMLAIVAHDLRSPLGIVAMSADVLTRQSTEDESVRTHAERIQSAARKMQGLIDDLLDLGTIEAGEMKIKPSRCALHELLSQAVYDLRPHATAKGITLLAEPPTEACAIRCDRHRILQVLGNLIGNAIRFTPAGGSIFIRSTLEPGSVRIAVTDTGAGIQPEHLARLFERYYQAPAGRVIGVGLGLFIAKGIVTAHRGQVSVESKPGAGSTFSFTIPHGASNDEPVSRSHARR